jgi:hypothetical protein
MADSSILYDEARALYAKDEYIAARDAYRKAALLAEPSRDDVYALSHAEKSAWLKVMWELVELYPSSLDVQMAFAQAAVRVGRDHIALDAYSRILSDFELSKLDEFHARIGRLEANGIYVATIHRPDLFIQDALYLRELGETFNAGLRLASALSRVHGAVCIPTLEQLWAALDPDALVSQLLERKIEELRILKQFQSP